MSRRTDMLGSTIQRELAHIILHELNDPRITGFPSITRVNVSADLANADVYLTIMGTPGQQTAALNAIKHSAGMMRTKLTKSLTLRVAPFLRFHLDEDLKKELEFLNVLRKVSEENAELDRKRAEAAAPVEGAATDSAPAEQSPAEALPSAPESSSEPAND